VIAFRELQWMNMPKQKDKLAISQLRAIVQRFASRRILVVGDLVVDHYIYGRTSRISREAPVLILKHQDEYVLPGQAANTANNICALGAKVYTVGAIGKDSTGKQLKSVMEKLGISTRGVIENPGASTLAKTRILAGGHHTCRQQVIRIDNDEKMTLNGKLHAQVIRSMHEYGQKVHAIVVSDYGYGLVNEQVWKTALEIKKQSGIPLILDSRYQFEKLKGATLITPNEEEAIETCGLTCDSTYDMTELGHELLRRTRAEGVLITRGNEGMVLFGRKKVPHPISIFGSDQVTDVTGAGDTVVASVSLALAAGADMREAAEIANIAGGLVVMKMGTATVTIAELLNAMDTAEALPQ
jgi:rfaE bifunctional protein kinase chain/domain